MKESKMPSLCGIMLHRDVSTKPQWLAVAFAEAALLFGRAAFLPQLLKKNNVLPLASLA
jgi:hypothetical protein